MELLEVCLVSVPANPEALLAASFGMRGAASRRAASQIRAAVRVAAREAVARATAQATRDLGGISVRLRILRACQQLDEMRGLLTKL